mmetsp:Transcript_4487/g.9653  ORF Transcript_4487/g.9653 Transcript_4487/m.9653 type:complete len:320 (-) Transcript_4487:117-1076(-)
MPSMCILAQNRGAMTECSNSSHGASPCNVLTSGETSHFLELPMTAVAAFQIIFSGDARIGRILLLRLAGCTPSCALRSTDAAAGTGAGTAALDTDALLGDVTGLGDAPALGDNAGFGDVAGFGEGSRAMDTLAAVLPAVFLDVDFLRAGLGASVLASAALLALTGAFFVASVFRDFEVAGFTASIFAGASKTSVKTTAAAPEACFAGAFFAAAALDFSTLPLLTLSDFALAEAVLAAFVDVAFVVLATFSAAGSATTTCAMAGAASGRTGAFVDAVFFAAGFLVVSFLVVSFLTAGLAGFFEPVLSDFFTIFHTIQESS